MASSLRRMKWKILSSLRSRLRHETIFLGLVVMMVTFVVYNITRGQHYIDEATGIDLSDWRQKDLIEEYAKNRKQELLELKQKNKNSERKNKYQSYEENYETRKKTSKEFRDADPVHRQMKEDAQRGIVWGKFREGRTYAADLGLKKAEEAFEILDNTKKKKDKAHASPNTKYFQDIEEKGYKLNNTIESGSLHGGKGHCIVYNVESYIDEKFDCQTLSIKPKTPICLYANEEDVHVSKHIREEGIWEPHMVMEFQNKLYGDPELGFIDIGANIGQYSLIAAAMGHKVVAVEPFLPNIKRFQKAVQIGGFQDRVTIVKNAISDTRQSVELKLYKDNKGGVSLTDEFADPWCEGEECPSQTHTIFMDDLLEVTNFDKAVMKIDIEGHEHRAFVRSLQLLKEIYVPYIIMEWLIIRSYHGSEIDESTDKSLVFQMVDFFERNGYHAYSMVTGARLKNAYWYAWPDDIIWKHELHDMQ